MLNTGAFSIYPDKITIIKLQFNKNIFIFFI